ncbi:hypothetical protein V6N13_091245 [Hibiscus sabdariffa]
MDNATPTPKSPLLSSPQQAALHQDAAADDDENVKQLKECSALYLCLQDCLVKSNRNWKSCQMEVQALKACNERRKNSSGKSLMNAYDHLLHKDDGTAVDEIHSDGTAEGEPSLLPRATPTINFINTLLYSIFSNLKMMGDEVSDALT